MVKHPSVSASNSIDLIERHERESGYTRKVDRIGWTRSENQTIQSKRRALARREAETNASGRQTQSGTKGQSRESMDLHNRKPRKISPEASRAVVRALLVLSAVVYLFQDLGTKNTTHSAPPPHADKTVQSKERENGERGAGRCNRQNRSDRSIKITTHTGGRCRPFRCWRRSGRWGSPSLPRSS